MVMTGRELQKLVSWIKQIPTLPPIVSEVVRVMTDPNSDAENLAKIISKDLSIASKVLRTVNTAYYGFERKITTIKDAVVVLGFKTVCDLAISVPILKRFGGERKFGKFQRGKFWEHSLCVGIAATVIARRVSYPQRETAFIAGLLHDIGKIIFDVFSPKEFTAAIDLAQSEDILLYDAEKIVYGVSHAEVGQWLADSWNLPGSICNAIGLHHTPALKTAIADFDMIGIIHLADIFSRTIGIGSGGDRKIPEISEAVADRFRQLLESDLASCFQEIYEEMMKARLSFR